MQKVKQSKYSIYSNNRKQSLIISVIMIEQQCTYTNRYIHKRTAKSGNYFVFII